MRSSLTKSAGFRPVPCFTQSSTKSRGVGPLSGVTGSTSRRSLGSCPCRSRVSINRSFISFPPFLHRQLFNIKHDTFPVMGCYFGAIVFASANNQTTASLFNAPRSPPVLWSINHRQAILILRIPASLPITPPTLALATAPSPLTVYRLLPRATYSQHSPPPTVDDLLEPTP